MSCGNVAYPHSHGPYYADGTMEASGAASGYAWCISTADGLRMYSRRVDAEIARMRLSEARWKARLAMWQTIAVIAGIVAIAFKLVWQ